MSTFQISKPERAVVATIISSNQRDSHVNYSFAESKSVDFLTTHLFRRLENGRTGEEKKQRFLDPRKRNLDNFSSHTTPSTLESNGIFLNLSRSLRNQNTSHLGTEEEIPTTPCIITIMRGVERMPWYSRNAENGAEKVSQVQTVVVAISTTESESWGRRRRRGSDILRFPTRLGIEPSFFWLLPRRNSRGKESKKATTSITGLALSQRYDFSHTLF